MSGKGDDDQETYLWNELKRLKAAAPKYDKLAADNSLRPAVTEPAVNSKTDPAGKNLIEPAVKNYNLPAADNLIRPAVIEPAAIP